MAFENRHVGCKEREKINRRRIFDTLRINFFETTQQTACIFSKENYRYDGNGNITAEKDGPFSEEEEFIFTYNYDKESGVYSTDYGFGLDAPKETEQTNPQDLFAYRRNYTWTYKSKTAMLFLTTYNNFLTQQARKGLNEKNLLTKSSDKNYTVHYRYGEDGQRALKYTEEGRSETLYFNNFFTIHIPIYDKDNPQGLRVHKHIFVGNSRLVTAMTHTDNHGDNDEQREKRYYYHTDHLGSAQFVTDWRGKQYEHIEYTPYGELWVEETAPGIDKLPFRFTGKELDEETGLYYYGARYLDPKYSRWLSGDPALSDYIPQAPVNDEAKKHNENLPGMGGVFNTVNLHVYHYAGNNPVKYVDPDGRSDSNIWIEMKNAVVPAINFDFGVDYYNLSVQRYNEGNYIEGFLYSVDCLCEAAYDGLIVYTGLKTIGGFIKSAFTTGATGIGKALINLRNADKTVDHIFSKEHIEGGIMKLGSSREDILNKIINVISKVDSNKIIEGSNEIRTVINDSEATIRLFVENGSIINIDAFAGYSNRVLGNLIEGL